MEDIDKLFDILDRPLTAPLLDLVQFLWTYFRGFFKNKCNHS